MPWFISLLITLLLFTSAFLVLVGFNIKGFANPMWEEPSRHEITRLLAIFIGLGGLFGVSVLYYSAEKLYPGIWGDEHYWNHVKAIGAGVFCAILLLVYYLRDYIFDVYIPNRRER